jgi:O-methyltransferase domain/Dimerisation domain
MEADGGSGLNAENASERGEELSQLVSGYRVSQAIYVVVKLGIPDLLADGPRGSDELAHATETHAGALYRVLRFLAGVGLFEERAPQQFGLTSLGAGLRRGAPGSLHAQVLRQLDPSCWEAWGQLLHSVRTGETAFDAVHGMGYFAYLGQHPDAARIFDQAMTSNTARSGSAITRAYDFSGTQRLVDVGGGQGLLLATVLQAYPTMHGVLFDRPAVVAGAPATLEAAGVADRCQVVGGDFFEAVPAGGDAYVLRQILHDWDDVRATQILKNCQRAMQGPGKVLVVERVIAPDYRQALPALRLDLEMLVNLGGLQRTEAEYRELFAATGFRLSAVASLGDRVQFSVFEGVPA